MKRLFLFFSIFIIQFSILNSIEVGGHLTQDTVWSPDNNPYLVTSGVYVNSDVTLTILPGTIVKFNADLYTEIGDDQFYFSSGEEPIAKFIRCSGKIIAEGTEQDSIVFTRIQDEQYYHWGTIYLPEESEFSVFKHCTFKYSAVTGFNLTEQPRGAIAVWNGSSIIENCSFIDNHRAIHIQRSVDEIQILDNYFDYNDFLYPHIMNSSPLRFISEQYISDDYPYTRPLIGNNIFRYGTAIYSDKSIDFINNNNNTFSVTRTSVTLSSTQGKSYLFDNVFGSCHRGIYTLASEDDTLYIRNNHFATDGGEGIYINDAYVEISDNYFEGCEIYTGTTSYGRVYNNTIIGGNVRAFSYLHFFQNIGFQGNAGMTITYRNESCFNNLSISNQYAFNGVFSGYYNNCIFICNNEIQQNGIHGNPILRNCIIDFPLDPPLIDGGGNIIVDSLQAQSIFEDIQNGDFHLASGSIAIDAGFDTLGYYYPFDMDYNKRVWDGDNNGTAIIDIGPYEYGAPQLGKIAGYITETNSGEIVDYVLLKMDNEPGNFTFADSAGYFEIQLPSGTYDLYADRVFYEDNIVYSVTVEDEQITEIDFNMTCTLPQVSIEDELIPNSSFQISNLSNHPNPFNPSTTISFSLIQNSVFVNLEVFNIKGQKIKTLINEDLQRGKHSIIWSGLDSNNKSVSSGIYLYKIKAGNRELVNRMLLLK